MVETNTAHLYMMFFFFFTVRSPQLPDLEDVSSRRHISDVDPLTVDVGIVGVITTWTQTLWTDTYEQPTIILPYGSNRF